MIPLLIILAVVALPIIWAIVIYNNLVRGRNHCDESWSDVDTELKRRYDLIPNLISTVKGYAAHEKEVLERVIAARNAAQANHGSPQAQAADENVLVGSLRQLMAIAEQYPVLKADVNFRHLQEELVNTEDRIQRSRRFYNANVRDYNNDVEVFPSNLIASWFSFAKREYFEIDPVAREPVKVDFVSTAAS
ncbi:MAG: LemA family protein [Phycisphaeraceae bacterium]|nr:LemA family protein [Phycisphaeraceae bacterium]